MNINYLPQYVFKAFVFLMILCPYLGHTQVYEEMIDPVDHPLSAIRISSGHSAPYFCDTDRDGDMDMISGAANGQLYYYENIGTEEQAIFDSIVITKLYDKHLMSKYPKFKNGFGQFSKPSGVDHDDDGDFDLFCGTKNSGIYYLKNNSGDFGPLQINHIYESSDKNNPLHSVDKNGYNFIAAAFYDMDVDSNPWSCFGTQNGDNIYYLEFNTLVDLYYPITNTNRMLHNLTPAIGDIDNDGDADLVLGTKSGDIIYLTGEDYNGLFGFDFNSTSSNPFSDIKVDSFSTPALVDIDGDGDLDLFVGQADGTFKHYKNVSIHDYIHIGTNNFINLDANIACSNSAAIYGNVGIGTAPGIERLKVNGKVVAEDFNTQVVNPPDYVFQSEYELRDLDDVKTYINEYSHLPEVPSAIEMETNGVDLGKMNMLLLKKIEELTLYLLDQEARMRTLESIIKKQQDGK